VLADLWDADSEVWAARWAPVFGEFAAEVVRRAAPKPGERLLDVGTGTGTALLLCAPLIGPEGRAVGIDRSQQMAERAKHAAASAGPAVRVLQMDATALDFPDEWFDVVVSNCGIPFMGLTQALSEIRRVLKPGGRLSWSDWHIDQVAAARILDDVFAKHKTHSPSGRLRRLREALGIWARAAEPLSGRGAFEGALKDAGFANVQSVTITHTLHSFDVDSFMEARLQRSVARLEMDEMSPPSRDAFLTDARASLAHLTRAGQFEVLWPIFYLNATK
jgi:ubiquinone/menaquinone biosynthesis C-methylase UbiE